MICKSANPYHYLYSRLYIFIEKMNGSRRDTNAHTCLGISVLLPQNVITANVFISHFVKSDILQWLNHVSKFEFVGFCILWFFFNLFYFSFNARYKKVLADYSAGNTSYSYMPGAAYVVLSFLLFCLVFALPKSHT